MMAQGPRQGQGPAPPPVPQFTLCSSNGDIIHIFPLPEKIARLILNSETAFEIQPFDLYIVTVSINGTIQIWDLNQRKSIFTKNTGLSKVLWATFVQSALHDDIIRIIILSREKGLYSVDISEFGFGICNLELNVNPAYCKPQIAFDEDHEILMIPDSEGSTLTALSLSANCSSKPVPLNSSIYGEKFPAPITFIKTILSAADGYNAGYLLIGTEDGKICLKSEFYESNKLVLNDARIPANYQQNDENEIIPLCCDGNSTYILIGTSSKLLFLLRLNNLAISCEKVVQITNKGINSMVLRKDGKIIATGGWDCRIRIFSFPTIEPKAVLTFHSKPINHLHFINSPMNSKYLLLASAQDSTLSVWDIYNQKSQ